MKLLLDTQCWLWMIAEPGRLGERARDLLADLRNRLYLSAASSWEIAIKARLGKIVLKEPAAAFVPKWMSRSGVLGLPVEHRHALHTSLLPDHHRDPFDRLLVAQAVIEKLPLVTSDRKLARYGVALIWADE